MTRLKWSTVASIFILFALSSLSARAMTYYVATGGNNSNACTDSGSPCATIAGVFAKAIVGDDVVVVAPGTYSATFTSNKSGTSGHPIVIQGYGIGGSCPTTSNSAPYGNFTTKPAPTVTLTGGITFSSNYVRMDCFALVGGGSGISVWPAPEIGGTVTNFTFDGTGSSTPSGFVWFDGISAALSSYSYGWTFTNNYVIGASNGFYIVCGRSSTQTCLFQNNEISTLQGDEPGSDHDYFDVWGQYVTIDHNYTHGNTIAACNGYDCHMDSVQTFCSGGAYSLNITVTNNVFFNHHEGVIVQDCGSGTIGNWTVANNVMAFPPVGATHPWCWVFENGNLGTNLFYNNTCFAGAMGFRNNSGSAQYKDNLYYTTGSAGSIYDFSGSTVTGANNLMDAASGSFSPTFTGDVVNVSPNLVSTASSGDLCNSCNFNLANTSSGAYNAGTSTAPTVTTDWLGTSRPQSTAYDIGMYEIPAAASAPTVTTTTATSITPSSASSGGNVTSDGGAPVTSRGVCYATTANPTTPCTSNGTGTGAYTSPISGLTASTTYHYRAYATNSAGTGYGIDLTFTTSASVPNFALNTASTHAAHQIGMNIGAPTYYDTYLLKNLIIVNPGMQAQQVRQIKTAASGSTTTFVTTNDYDVQAVNASAGYTFQIPCHGGQGASPGTCAGGASGYVGSVTANTVNNGSSGTMTYTVSPAAGSTIAVNDSAWIIGPMNATTPAGEFTTGNGWPDFGWQPAATGSGTASIDTTPGDLPPILNGFATANQCVRMAVTGGGDSAQVFTYFDTTSGNLNYNFNGNFHMGIRASVLSGSGGTLTMQVQRSSSGLNMSNTASLSGGWNTYSVAMTGSEANTATQGNVMIRYTLTGSSATAVCLVGATLTNDADSNPTLYRNQTVTNLQSIHPGILRYNTTGQQGTSLLNWITPQPYRMMSGVSASAQGAVATQQGIHEFLTLAAYLATLDSAGTTRAVSIVVPPTWSATDYANLANYLGSDGSTTYGGFRIALGQTVPWTQLLNIYLEMGNETWNSQLDGGLAGYPQYSVSSTAYWNYVHPAIAACQALKGAASWNSTREKCIASVQTSSAGFQTGYFTTVDTNHYVDMQAINQYMQGDPGSPLTNCGAPNQWISAFTEPWANSHDTGSASGFYQTANAGLLSYVYEYQDHSIYGSCSQVQVNGYPEGEGWSIPDVIAPLHASKQFGTLDSAFWQYLQPSTNTTGTGGATTIALWGAFTGSGGAFVNARPSALALSLANNCIGTAQTRFDTTPTNVPTYNFTGYNGVDAISNIPTMQEFGFKNGNTRCLLVANLDQSNTQSFTVSGTDAPVGTVTEKLITGTINATNEGANASPTITIGTSTPSVGSLSIPPNSLASFAWNVATTCDLVANQPSYGFVTLPGSERQLTVHQANCPTATVSNIAMSGTTTSATITFTVPDATIFTVGKQIVASGFPDTFQLNELLNGVTLTVATATGTTVTATYNNAQFVAGSTAITGTITQNTRVNWSTSSGTLSCTSSCLPTVLYTSDGTPGALSTVEPASPYPVGGYTLTSTHQMTVTATSVDDPTKTVTYTINQGPASTTVRLNTKYTQVYLSQAMLFWANVTGNTNGNVTWSVSGTGCSITGATNKRNALVSSNATGTCTVTATSVADGTKTDSAAMYVANAAIPGWASAPPDSIPPTPCAVDASKTVYEVGPGQTYTTLNAVPWQTLTVPWEVRVHYATYAEYIQIPSIGNGNANYLCGVEDGSGHFPVITGANAHGPSWFTSSFLVGTGLIVLYPNSSTCVSSADSTGSCGPTNLSIAGFVFTGANGSNTYFFPDGTTTSNWGDGASCVSARTGANIAVDAIKCTASSQGVATYANQNGGFASLTQNLYLGRSYFAQNGIANNATNHPLYLQSLYANVVDRVYVDAPVASDEGSCMKLRGQGNIVFDSYCASGYSRTLDFVESQDNSDWITFENGLSNGGPYNTSATGFTLGGQAARLESMFKDYAFSSIVNGGGLHYMADHDDNEGSYGMNARYGRLYSWFNTFTSIGSGYDTSNQFSLNYFLMPRFYLANDINWQASNFAINTEASFIGDFHTNVSNSGFQNNTTPVWGGRYNSGNTNGWSGVGQSSGTYYMVRPLNNHVTGNLISDFITTGTQPYNSVTFAPAGVAIGTASAITGNASEFSIPFQALAQPAVYVPRSTYNDIGAQESIAPPTGLTIRITSSVRLTGNVVAH